MVSAREHNSVHQETLEILICYMCFELGSINEERLCVSSTDLHLESLNTFGQNQPGPFYEQLISLDKTPFVWFLRPIVHTKRGGTGTVFRFSLDYAISVTLPWTRLRLSEKQGNTGSVKVPQFRHELPLGFQCIGAGNRTLCRGASRVAETQKTHCHQIQTRLSDQTHPSRKKSSLTLWY